MARSPRSSVWLAGEEKAKAPKRKAAEPGGEGALDRDRIVATTVRMLDAEGLAKFSMRRLAAELGVTAMSVYWYVDNKDDLLELALDRAAGDMRAPDLSVEDADWREQVRELATEYRAMLIAHPWVARLVGQYLNVGPNSMAFADVALRVERNIGIAKDGANAVLGVIFQFVYGFATVEALSKERRQESGVTEDEYLKQVRASVADRPEFSDLYKEAAEMMEARSAESVAAMRERDFAFALDMMIAGIEAMRNR